MALTCPECERWSGGCICHLITTKEEEVKKEMLRNASEEECLEIGDMVVDAALELFSYANVEYDFCVRYTGYNVVFGGTNRLIFDPVKGFSASSMHCTPDFLDKAQDMEIRII